MINILLEHAMTVWQQEAVRQALEQEVLNNPNMYGAEFEINRGDFTCIRGLDGYDGTALMGIIYRAVEDA